MALCPSFVFTQAFKVVSFRRRGDQSTAGTGWPNTEASSAAAKPSEPGESCSRLQHWATVLLGMLCVSGNPAGAYGGLLYFPAFLSSTAGLYSVKVTALMSMVSTVVGMLASPVCGVLGDLFGPGRMLLLGAVLVAVLSWPLWLLAVSGGTTLAFLAMSLWAIMLAVQV